MQGSTKLWRGLAIGAAVVVMVVLVMRGWVVPALIVGQLQALSGGRVTIRDWWLNVRSAGVVGLAVHEARGADSPVWANVARVETDLSLGRLLTGRLSPRRVVLEAPRLVF